MEGSTPEGVAKELIKEGAEYVIDKSTDNEGKEVTLKPRLELTKDQVVEANAEMEADPQVAIKEGRKIEVEKARAVGSLGFVEFDVDDGREVYFCFRDKGGDRMIKVKKTEGARGYYFSIDDEEKLSDEVQSKLRKSKPREVYFIKIDPKMDRAEGDFDGMVFANSKGDVLGRLGTRFHLGEDDTVEDILDAE